MAKVQGTFYSGETQRRGTTPVSPPNAVDDPVGPINPPGSGGGAGHNPVTIGSPANGLSISASQELTIGLASTSSTGALSNTDWNTFNEKLNLTSPLTGYTVGANTALANTDTILQAFEKVQGQINARVSGTIASGQVAFGTGANTVGGANDFIFNNTIKTLSIGLDNTVGVIGSRNGLKLKATTNNGVGIVMQRLADPSGTPSTSFQFNLSNNGDFNFGTNLGGSFTYFYNFTSSLIGFHVDNTGRFAINTTTPTNTLDVNGTLRVRTVNPLGTAPTTVWVGSATGVLSSRTLAEFAGDLGAVTESTQVISTNGTINDLATNASTLVFTGTTVTLTGIVAVANGVERTIVNRTGSNMTISYLSASSVAANRVNFAFTIPNGGVLRLKYSTNSGNVWIFAGSIFNPDAGNGFFTNQFVGIGRTPSTNISLILRSNSNTNTGFALQTERLDGTVTATIQSTQASIVVPLSIGGIAIGTTYAIQSRGNASGFNQRWTNTLDVTQSVIDNSGNFTTLGNIWAGSTSVFSSAGARMRVTGSGATTGITLLLEDSAGTDNVQFLDNGQIRFLRLPTSSAGLAAGTLWNDGGTLKIA